MRVFRPLLMVPLLLAVGLLWATPRVGRAQGGGAGQPITGGTGICSGGGCVPKTDCGVGSLCEPFPDHPAYDPNVEFRKGAALLKAGDYKEAKHAFERVLYLTPTNSDVLFALGVADVDLGDLAAGAEAFEKALRWNPKQINAARELAITDLKLGQADRADLQLAALKRRAEKCGGGCRESADLKEAIDAVETARARGDRS